MRYWLVLLCGCLCGYSSLSLGYSVVEVQTPTQAPWLLWAGLGLVLALLLAVSYLWVANRRLLRAQHKLSVLWNHVPDILTEVDAQGKICALNQVISSDMPLEKVLGTSSFDYLNESDGQLFREQLKSALTTGKDSHYQLQISLPAGTTYLSNRIVPLTDSSATEPRALVITTDISHHKEAESILNQAKKQADENAQAQSRFLANMSHEIRTPLNGIQGMITLIGDASEPGEVSQYTTPLLSSVEHLRRIVDDILDLSKSGAGHIELDEADTSLWHILDDLEALYLPQASQKHIHLHVRLASNVPRMIHVDAFRLRQVLYNLLSNAVKFTSQGSVEVMISMQNVPQQRLLKISVKDTGMGIPVEQQAHIFDVFRQANASTAHAHGGTGLGLSICRNLVEVMGGVISVESEPNKGSEFWFTLPLKACDAVAQLPQWQDRGVYLALEDNDLELWFRGFFQTLGIEVHELEKNAHLPPHSLLVSDHVNNVQEEWLWWLGADYDMNLVQGVSLTKPLRREALCKRLQDYEKLTKPVTSNSQDTKAEKASQGHLLLVEDNLTNQLVVRKTLEKMDYQVTIANNGLEGVQAYEAGEFVGIIMDIQMPVMDGIEATRKIRQLGGRYVPIIALTANAQKEIEEACFAAGMDAFLTKPVNRLELQNTLESVLGSDLHQRQSSA